MEPNLVKISNTTSRTTRVINHNGHPVMYTDGDLKKNLNFLDFRFLYI
jgi:hypothetical protein